eukprot:COSAG01_NODE_14_length_41020_cov_40.702133_3_plen_111_part_00
MENTLDYIIQFPSESQVDLIGSLRLLDVADYDNIFAPIIVQITQSSGLYTLNLKKLIYLNSAGITGLAKILIMAKAKGKKLHLLGDANVPWQNKALDSFAMLSPLITTST